MLKVVEVLYYLFFKYKESWRSGSIFPTLKYKRLEGYVWLKA